MASPSPLFSFLFYCCLLGTVSQTDCFVTLWLPTASREKVRTRTISNCPHPEWDESFTFQIQTQVKVSGRGPHPCALPTCLLPSPPPVPVPPMSFLRLFVYRLTCPINLSSHSPTASFLLCVFLSESANPSTFSLPHPPSSC